VNNNPLSFIDPTGFADKPPISIPQVPMDELSQVVITALHTPGGCMSVDSALQQFCFGLLNAFNSMSTQAVLCATGSRLFCSSLYSPLEEFVDRVEIDETTTYSPQENSKPPPQMFCYSGTPPGNSQRATNVKVFVDGEYGAATYSYYLPSGTPIRSRDGTYRTVGTVAGAAAGGTVATGVILVEHLAEARAIGGIAGMMSVGHAPMGSLVLGSQFGGILGALVGVSAGLGVEGNMIQHCEMPKP
jgi:hypothetical protein